MLFHLREYASVVANFNVAAAAKPRLPRHGQLNSYIYSTQRSALISWRHNDLATGRSRSNGKPRIFHLKTVRDCAQVGAAWRILEKALRGASVRVRQVRAFFPAVIFRSLSSKERPLNMRKTYVVNFLVVLSLAVFCAGCGKSDVGGTPVGGGNPILGVYEHKWQQPEGECTQTYDFRSDGTCMYTSYVPGAGWGLSKCNVVGRWAVEDGKVVMRLNMDVQYYENGNNATLDKPVTLAKDSVFATLTREGIDLIRDNYRFIKIR